VGREASGRRRRGRPTVAPAPARLTPALGARGRRERGGSEAAALAGRGERGAGERAGENEYVLVFPPLIEYHRNLIST
jgi:hypothetical protein